MSYAVSAEQLDELVDRARRCGLSSADFAVAVKDAAADFAQRLNAAGEEAQLRFLLTRLGWSAVCLLIDQASEELSDE